MDEQTHGEHRPDIAQPPSGLAQTQSRVVGQVASRPRLNLSVEYVLFFVLGGVSLSVIVALVWGAKAGGLVLSLMLMIATVARLIAPEPNPRGLRVRSRLVDVATLGGITILLLFLDQTVPNL